MLGKGCQPAGWSFFEPDQEVRERQTKTYSTRTAVVSCAVGLSLMQQMIPGEKIPVAEHI